MIQLHNKISAGYILRHFNVSDHNSSNTENIYHNETYI